jgi:hypothetical protein
MTGRHAVPVSCLPSQGPGRHSFAAYVFVYKEKRGDRAKPGHDTEDTEGARP